MALTNGPHRWFLAARHAFWIRCLPAEVVHAAGSGDLQLPLHRSVLLLWKAAAVDLDDPSPMDAHRCAIAIPA